jgi:hypothetical protein
MSLGLHDYWPNLVIVPRQRAPARQGRSGTPELVTPPDLWERTDPPGAAMGTGLVEPVTRRQGRDRPGGGAAAMGTGLVEPVTPSASWQLTPT